MAIFIPFLQKLSMLLILTPEITSDLSGGYPKWKDLSASQGAACPKGQLPRYGQPHITDSCVEMLDLREIQSTFVLERMTLTHTRIILKDLPPIVMKDEPTHGSVLGLLWGAVSRWGEDPR